MIATAEISQQQAARIPLEVAKCSLEILTMAEKVVARGSPNAITDGAVAAMLARTAGLAALYNVKINLISIKDRRFVREATTEGKHLEVQFGERERRILKTIKPPLLRKHS